MAPYRFEQLVLDLLVAMGYGGSRAEAAQVTQKSKDHGIDGTIHQDRIELDVIYVQAKRWQATIGREQRSSSSSTVSASPRSAPSRSSRSSRSSGWVRMTLRMREGRAEAFAGGGSSGPPFEGDA